MKYKIDQLTDASEFSCLKGRTIKVGISSRKLKMVDLDDSESYCSALVIWTRGSDECEVVTGPAEDQRIQQGW